MICNGIAARECLNLGLKAGLDLQKMIDVFRVSTGNSARLESLDHVMNARKLPPVGKAPRRGLGNKDRDLAIALAEKVGANIPVLRFIAELDAESAYDAYSAMMRQFD